MTRRRENNSELFERSAQVQQSRDTCRKVRASLREADAVRIDTRIALNKMRWELS
ncbi:MAG: hypothetical protein ABJ263_21290 [Tateyamaria sp.]|uniref:hypothetical protein n=1 Tax=Tateyamaria sp. TaxID=1929288 RepID=UPI00328BD110